ncbi:MAG: M16 family metallopeptidase [Acidobacteriota bacterium]
MAPDASNRFRLRFEKHRLPNGLTLILYEDHRLPQAAVDIWYHVGSKDEKPGRTGLAHLFEHMMFQGSAHSPEDYFRSLEEVGARLNGSTSEDRTNYWEVVPASYLERALFLEADRMGWLLPGLTQEKLDNQREVVKNERRQTVENEPYGVAEEVLLANLYPEGHPYHHPVIGSMADLDAASLEDVHAFFSKYYTPSNATLCVAGDVDPARALDQVGRLFGEIPAGPTVSPVTPWIPILSKPFREVVEDRVQLSRLTLAWPTVCHLTPEDATLSVLAYVLATGKDSRLMKRMQIDENLAQSVWCGHLAGEVAGSFQAVVTVRPGISLERAEDALWEEMERLGRDGVAPEEVRAAVDSLTVGVLKRLQMVGGFGSVSDMLNYYEVFGGDPGGLVKEFDRYARVSAEDVADAARRFLRRDGFAAVSVVPARPRPSALERGKLPAAGEARPFAFPEVCRDRLKNGIDVWTLTDPTVPLVSVAAVLEAGSAQDPPDRPGLAFFTAGLLDEAAAGQDAVALAIRQKRMATALATRVDAEKVTLSLTLLRERLGEGMALLSDVLLRPDFRPEDVERVRKEHLASLLRRLDEAPELGDRALKALLFGEASPYGHPTDGYPDGLESFRREEAVGFHGDRYHPGRMLLAFVGDVSREEALTAAESSFGSWAPAGAPPEDPDPDRFLPGGGFLLVDKPGAPQAYISAGLPALSRLDPRDPAFLVFNAVLGGQFTSRINMNLREDKGYTYGAHAYLDPKPGVRPWVFGSAVQADKTVDSIREVLGEIERILSGSPVTQEEFVKARENLILRHPQNFETQAQLLGGLAALWRYGLPLDFHARFLSALRSLRLEQVIEAGAEVLVPERLSWVVVGDRRELEGPLQALGLGPLSVREGR